MGCDIHLKLEWRYKEPTNKILCRAEYDENGEKIEDEVVFQEHSEWRSSNITNWGKEWSDRVYGMFAVLSDVRNYWSKEHLPIRGFPKDAANDTKTSYAYYKIFDTQKEADDYNKMTEDWDGYHYAVSKEKAEKYAKDGYCEYIDIDGEKRLSCPDWHSANWCTTEEMEKCINDVFFDKNSLVMVGGNEEWLALLGAMKGYDSIDNVECRAVFWFDN